ncbi:hypothetical protein Tco_0682419 [Tanacetum coccineum]|uniref:Uncharacterized protein n=1 Tax=Tanacetum coccineum TaxID=301880 RepID=A0ABQ4XR46_9ASTR
MNNVGAQRWRFDPLPSLCTNSISTVSYTLAVLTLDEDLFPTDWNKPPKKGDGVWHIKIELIDPDGDKFNRVFQSIPTTRKLSEREKVMCHCA